MTLTTSLRPSVALVGKDKALSHARQFCSLFMLLLLFGNVDEARANSVYYAEPGFGDTISRASPAPGIASGSRTDLVFIRNQDPRALALDKTNGHVYFADGFGISRANLDGSNKQSIITGIGAAPGDIEIDAANGHLYYSTLFSAGRSILRANKDGSSITVVHNATTLAAAAALSTVTTNDVSNLSLDLDAGRLYWTADDGAAAGRIALNSSSLSGGLITQHWIASSRGTAISKMDIDFDNGHLYYTVGSTTAEVRRSTLSNGSITTLASGLGRPNAIALDLDNNDIYFNVGSILYEADLDGSNRTSLALISNNSFSIADLEVGPTVVPLPASMLLFLSGVFLCKRRRMVLRSN